MYMRAHTSTGAELFDMSYGPVILGDSLSELTMLLPKKYVYGLGGHAFSFGERNGSAFVKKTMFNMEDVTMEGRQSAVPVFMAMDSERNFFGVHVEAERPLTIQEGFFSALLRGFIAGQIQSSNPPRVLKNHCTYWFEVILIIFERGS